MPRRDDLHKILLIGSGPIVIGQACEFDYSGTQACKALREEGYEVVLVNSNPATIMTDPNMADRTYIEPLTWETVEKVIAKERPDALLPTLGGQTGLNVAMDLHRHGVLDKYGVEMIGADADVIAKAEERDRFKVAMEKIGLRVCRGATVHDVDEARKVVADIGLPCVVRPSFTMGGSGSSVAYNRDELDLLVRSGLDQSPVSEVLVEQSIHGWKEYEMEVMRDMDDNVVIVCSIENFDAMGVHTGDSITVAPAQTLTDKEYQRMRDASLAVIREIGVETGGSNIQFATHPETGEMIVIEMNPRVSRSSALASKATGFPIAKIAAKLAVGYRLHELPNDITRETKACFEPTIDYVVTKIPRFAFEKFPEADDTLTTQMKSVGETMAIGRTFKESFQKALRGLEVGSFGFGCDGKDLWGTAEQPSLDDIRAKLTTPGPERAWYLRYALKSGMGIEEIYQASAIDPWFLQHLAEIVELEEELRTIADAEAVDDARLRTAKQYGFSDRQLATIWNSSELEVRKLRVERGIVATFKSVDTCAAEFEAYTPYYYSTYEDEDETPAPQPGRPRIMILGGGPNRIGQGIEFDYCCCHASFALREMGIESIMVNSNPETVSTDYDTSDLLFFEPLTAEDVLELIETEMQSGELLGVVVQYGGQTPLKLAPELEAAGVPILGTAPDAIDLAEDRERFKALLDDLKLKQPPNAIAHDEAEARQMAEELGFPLVLRPSHVLGGRGMEIVRDIESFSRYIREAVHVSGKAPLLLDRYLSDASEVDVDAVCDGENVWISGIMEHIEEAGVHSGDSACSLPPHSLSDQTVSELRRQTKALAKAIDVKGLMNVQYAVKDGVVYLIEVNPRASRTVPFVAKTIGAPVAKIAAKVMAGAKLTEFDTPSMPTRHIAVKEAVMPFSRFPGVDPILGPEMRSTGEVMGIDERFEAAFAKAELGAGVNLPKSGTVFISLKESDKAMMIESCHRLTSLGFKILATTGTAKTLEDSGVPVQRINKVFEGRPHIVDAIKNGEVQLVFNTTEGQRSMIDSYSIRRTALEMKVPCYTTASASRAAVKSIAAIDAGQLEPRSLQSYRNGPSGG